MKRTLKKQLSDKDTVEPLLKSLEQAIETKKQNVEAIARIRETLAGRIDEMQQAKAMVDGIMDTLPADSGTPSIPPKPPWSLTLNLQNVWEFFKQWIIPAVIMFIFLLTVMWALQSNTEKGDREMPRLIETVNASSSVGCIGVDCVPLDRTHENYEDAEAEESAGEEEESCSDVADSAAVCNLPSAISSSNHRQIRRPFLRNLLTP